MTTAAERRAAVIDAIARHLCAASEDDYAAHCLCGAHAAEAVDLSGHVADDVLAHLDALEEAPDA